MEFAQAFFSGLNDGDSCITREDVERNLGSEGVEVDFLPNVFLDIIVAMCEADPGLYTSNTDCAMVADTCEMFFSGQQA